MMIVACKLVIALTVVSCSAVNTTRNAKILLDRNPDIHLTTPELLGRYGYRVEIHRVVTEDGYILAMHRIVGRLVNGDSRQFPKGMVLLQHGMGSSSADWVLMGPGRSLAYLLADEGYDVWLGNNRGNIYSRQHISLSPDDRDFWDFSWHEMGVYDLPAMIDRMLREGASSREKILYVGHSQGCTQFFVMASEKPEYNEKIALMTALAPAVYTANMRGPVTKLSTLTSFGVWVGERFGYPEYTPRSTWAKFVSSYFCKDAPIAQFLCSNIIFLIAGYNPDELDPVSLPSIIGHIPAGASWKQFVHYGQGSMEQERFRKFDYDNLAKNMRLYNSTEPPDYPLERVTAPLVFFKSEADLLSTTKDIALLQRRLKSLIASYNVPGDTFSHYDFLWGTHAPQLIYVKLMALLEEYSNSSMSSSA